MSPRCQRVAGGLVVAGLAALLAGCVPPPPEPGPTVDVTVPAPPPPTILTPSAPVPSSVPVTAPPRPPAHATGPTPAPPVIPTSAQLRAALLVPGDVSGFRAGHDVAGGGSGGCAALDTGLDPGARTTVMVLLERGGTGPYLRERLTVYSGQSARAAVATVRGAPSSCPTFVVTDPVLGRVDYTTVALSVPRYGDEAAGVRLTAVAEQYPTVRSYEDFVVVRHGPVLLQLAHTSVTTIDNALTGRALATADGKVDRRW